MIFWCNFLDLSLFFYPSLAFSQSADCYNEYNHSLHATYCNGALQAFCSRDRRLEASEKNVGIDRIRCGAIKFATGQLLKCSRRSKRGQLLKYDISSHVRDPPNITQWFKDTILVLSREIPRIVRVNHNIVKLFYFVIPLDLLLANTVNISQFEIVVSTSLDNLNFLQNICNVAWCMHYYSIKVRFLDNNTVRSRHPEIG